jgi:hypothetical protein
MLVEVFGWERFKEARMKAMALKSLALVSFTALVLMACSTPAVPESPASTDITLENSVLENPDAGTLENVTVDSTVDELQLGSLGLGPILPDLKLSFYVAFEKLLIGKLRVLWPYSGSTTVKVRMTVYTRRLPRTTLMTQLRTLTATRSKPDISLIGPFTARGADNCLEVLLFSSSGGPVPVVYPRGKKYTYCPYARP